MSFPLSSPYDAAQLFMQILQGSKKKQMPTVEQALERIPTPAPATGNPDAAPEGLIEGLAGQPRPETFDVAPEAKIEQKPPAAPAAPVSNAATPEALPAPLKQPEAPVPASPAVSPLAEAADPNEEEFPADAVSVADALTFAESGEDNITLPGEDESEGEAEEAAPVAPAAPTQTTLKTGKKSESEAPAASSPEAPQDNASEAAALGIDPDALAALKKAIVQPFSQSERVAIAGLMMVNPEMGMAMYQQGKSKQQAAAQALAQITGQLEMTRVAQDRSQRYFETQQQMAYRQLLGRLQATASDLGVSLDEFPLVQSGAITEEGFPEQLGQAQAAVQRASREQQDVKARNEQLSTLIQQANRVRGVSLTGLELNNPTQETLNKLDSRIQDRIAEVEATALVSDPALLSTTRLTGFPVANLVRNRYPDWAAKPENREILSSLDRLSEQGAVHARREGEISDETLKLKRLMTESQTFENSIQEEDYTLETANNLLARADALEAQVERSSRTLLRANEALILAEQLEDEQGILRARETRTRLQNQIDMATQQAAKLRAIAAGIQDRIPAAGEGDNARIFGPPSRIASTAVSMMLVELENSGNLEEALFKDEATQLEYLKDSYQTYVDYMQRSGYEPNREQFLTHWQSSVEAKWEQYKRSLGWTESPMQRLGAEIGLSGPAEVTLPELDASLNTPSE